MFYDVSLRSVSNSSSECLSERCSRHHHWETKQTKLLRSMSNKVPSSEVTIFFRFLRALRRRKLKWKIWKICWFSMSLYEFKSSPCSPCSYSTQRRRKVYRCWVSSSPIKCAKYETCKYDVNHHGWWWAQGEKQIHFLQCRKDPIDSSHIQAEKFTIKGPRLYKKQIGTHKKKTCVNTYAHATASQICLQNICMQQQNFPRLAPLLGPNLASNLRLLMFCSHYTSAFTDTKVTKVHREPPTE